MEKELSKELKDNYKFSDIKSYKKDDGCHHLEFFLTPEQVEMYKNFPRKIKDEIYACEYTYGGRTMGDGILGSTNIEFKEPNILTIEGHYMIIRMIIQDLFLTIDGLLNKRF